MKIPTVTDVEKVAGPVSRWVFRCHDVATLMVNGGVVTGRPVYGLWTGPIAKGSAFFGRPIARHGWVQLSDGFIIDPTRWVFEAVEPYIYYGPSDNYDAGARVLRKAVRNVLQPNPPKYDSDERQFEFTEVNLPTPEWNFVEKELNIDIIEQEPGFLSLGQVFWIANLTPDELGEHAKPLYEALERLHQKMLIPIDNWLEVMGET